MRTAIGLLWATGLRPSELVQLRQADMHPKGRTVRVARTKFKKECILPVDATAWAALEAYGAIRDRTTPVGHTDRVNRIMLGPDHVMASIANHHDSGPGVGTQGVGDDLGLGRSGSVDVTTHHMGWPRSSTRRFSRDEGPSWT